MKGVIALSTLQISLNVPNEILLDLNTTESLFTNYIKRFVAMDLYAKKNISLGYCAEFAEMTKEDFVKFLGESGVSIFDFENENEFSEEAENAWRSSKLQSDNSLM